MGNSVFVSQDAGRSFNLTFTEATFFGESGPSNWPKLPSLGSNADYNAIGLDVGWWDTDGFFSFGINQRNSAEAGGSGLFFAYYTHDAGSYWHAPFTRYADTGPPAPKKKWKSTGMEETANYHIKFHPSNAQVGYVSMSDIGGMATQDGGKSYRMCQYTWNSVYDYGFDPSNDEVVYLAANFRHDYLQTYAGPLDPPSSYANASLGGIYISTDRCTHLTQLTPANGSFAQDYLSVKYNPVNHTIYGGTWGAGVEVSSDGGKTWSFLNAGLPVYNATTPNLTINQLEVDPYNGNVYALVTGDWPNFTNRGKAGIYFLDVADGKTSWTSLRGTLQVAPNNPATYIYYPVRFAVDWFSATSASTRARSTLWLADTAIWSPISAFSNTGIWNSMDGGSHWSRKLGYNYPTSVDLDSFGCVYATGATRTDVPPGYLGHGSLYSDDGGSTWKQNLSMQEKRTVWSVTPDPNNSQEIFLGTSGNGLLYGPRPQ